MTLPKWLPHIKKTVLRCPRPLHSIRITHKVLPLGHEGAPIRVKAGTVMTAKSAPSPLRYYVGPLDGSQYRVHRVSNDPKGPSHGLFWIGVFGPRPLESLAPFL